MPWLFLAYPLLAHLAAVAHSERLAWIAVTVLIAVPLLPALRHRRAWAWIVLCAVTLALYGCAYSGIAGYLMYAPPVLIPGAVMSVFLSSLREGQVPVVTRIATQIRGTLPPELASYTRHVTQFWVALLLIMALSSALLAAFASRTLWSLITNVVDYVLLAAVFLLEYLYRRWRFRHLPHESFRHFISALFTARVR
ncbi:MAG: hypothetical protein ABUS47_12215 [Steroidobacter sp.]